MLNRAALLLHYKAPAVRWIDDVDPNPSATPVTLEDVNSERTVYLISDEDADSADAVRAWVEVNFRALFESELEAWYTDPDLWPSPFSLVFGPSPCPAHYGRHLVTQPSADFCWLTAGVAPVRAIGVPRFALPG